MQAAEPHASGPAGAGDRRRARRSGMVAGAAAFLLLIAWHPLLATPALTLRLGVLLVVVAVGIPALVASFRRSQPAEVAAAAWVTWAALSALVASTALAWTGEYPLGTGALFVAAVASSWLLARRLDRHGRRGLVLGVLGGACLNAVVAVVQMAVDLGIDDLALVDDRSAGLAGNPVFLGAITAAAVPLLATTIKDRPALSVVAAAVLAAATQVSGTRIALAGLVVGLAVVVAAARPRRALAAASVLAMVGGVAIGAVLTTSSDRQSQVATARLASPAEGASGVGQRLEVWQAGVGAAADRPITGWGPGRFQAGASPHQSLRLARLAGPGRIFTDAHNLAVEHLATTGVVGLALMAAWLGLAGQEAWRRRRVPLLGAVAVLVLFHAVEPQNVAVTPLLGALLGAAGAPERGRSALPAPARRAAWVLVVPAVVAGSLLLVGDARAKVGVLDFDAGAATTASDLMPMWAAPVALEARIATFEHETTGDPDALERALASTAEAVQREPDDPAVLELRAATLGRAGLDDEAAAAWRRVLEANPWSVQATTALRRWWLDRGAAVEAGACTRILELLDSDDPAPQDVGVLRRTCAGR